MRKGAGLRILRSGVCTVLEAPSQQVSGSASFMHSEETTAVEIHGQWRKYCRRNSAMW